MYRFTYECLEQYYVTMKYLFQAPRAKMNQQRSRRFRASKEGMEAAVEKQRVKEEILAKGKEHAP